jgi:hypothetical protein
VTDDRRLAAVLEAIAEQARRDPRFLDDLELALKRVSGRKPPTGDRQRRAGRPHRRSPAAVDPFDVLREGGTGGLRDRLAPLSVDQLRDIVAEYRIEPYTLAMKWKTPSRLIDLIVDTIEQRSRKGDAFR